jgi:hypothetical protein
MDYPQYYEILGYLGSLLVAISLTMTSIIRLRIINLIGGSAFFIYGYLIGATPIMIANLLISSINIYSLFQMKNNKEYFSVLEVGTDSQYWDAFIDYYKNEIVLQRPDFQSDKDKKGKLCFFLLRDAIPAGIFQAKYLPNRELLVELDYVIPKYRDFKLGTFLFQNQCDFFLDKGLTKILSKSLTPTHQTYLKKMKFNYDETNEIYFLNLL